MKSIIIKIYSMIKKYIFLLVKEFFYLLITFMVSIATLLIILGLPIWLILFSLAKIVVTLIFLKRKCKNVFS